MHTCTEAVMDSHASMTQIVNLEARAVILCCSSCTHNSWVKTFFYSSSPWIWAPDRFNRPPAEFSGCIVSLTGLTVDGLQEVQRLKALNHKSGRQKGKKVNDNLPFILLTPSHPLACFHLLLFCLFLFYSCAVFFVSSISYFSCLNHPPQSSIGNYTFLVLLLQWCSNVKLIRIWPPANQNL